MASFCELAIIELILQQTNSVTSSSFSKDDKQYKFSCSHFQSCCISDRVSEQATTVKTIYIHIYINYIFTLNWMKKGWFLGGRLDKRQQSLLRYSEKLYNRPVKVKIKVWFVKSVSC